MFLSIDILAMSIEMQYIKRTIINYSFVFYFIDPPGLILGINLVSMRLNVFLVQYNQSKGDILSSKVLFDDSKNKDCDVTFDGKF